MSIAVQRRLLVHHARGGIVHIHEDRARAVAREVEQLVQVLVVVGGLHDGIADHRIGHVDPTDHVRVDLGQLVEVDRGDVVPLGVLDGILLQVLVGRLRGAIAQLGLDEHAPGHEQEGDADDDQHRRQDVAGRGGGAARDRTRRGPACAGRGAGRRASPGRWVRAWLRRRRASGEPRGSRRVRGAAGRDGLATRSRARGGHRHELGGLHGGRGAARGPATRSGAAHLGTRGT